MSSLNKREGILTARMISEGILKSVKNIFFDIFIGNDSALYSWGSLARREMCTFSDIDIIILHKGGHVRTTKVKRFIEEVSLRFPGNKIDLLQEFNELELIKIAKIDGNDRQALTMARLESKKNILSDRFKNTIITNFDSKIEKIRELLYIMVNLKKVYPVLFSQNDLKFGEYCLRYLNYTVLYVKYIIDEENDLYNTETALGALLKKSVISNDLYRKSLNALDYFLFHRNQIQIKKNLEFNVLENYSSCIEAESSLSGKKPSGFGLEKHKQSVKLLMDILFSKTIRLAEEELGEKTCTIIGQLLENHDREVETSALKLNSEIVTMILSYCTRDQSMIDYLYEKNKFNWYIVFGIANNPHSAPATLYKLINPENKSKKIKLLYNDFAWRNIYLYVARNPSADKETLDFIIKRKSCRRMDIDAAKSNLLKKLIV